MFPSRSLGSGNGCVEGRAAGAGPGSFRYVSWKTAFPLGVTQGLDGVDHRGKAMEIQPHQLRPGAWLLKGFCPREEWWYWWGQPQMSP